MNPNVIQQTQSIPANKINGWRQTITKIETFLGEKPFLGSFLLAVLLVVPILVIFKFFYQLCDDTYALFLLKGIVLNGTPSEFNFEENAFLSLILKKLYLQYPNIQWYSTLFVFTHFLSVWGMLAALNLGTHRFFKNVIFIIGSIVAIERLLIPLQWTTVAGVAAMGGTLLLAGIWRKEDSKFHLFGFFLSFILIMTSLLIRPSSLELIALLSLPIGVYFFWKTKLTPSRRTILVFLAVTMVLSLAAVEYDHFYYSRNQSWNNSMEFFQQFRWLNSFRNLSYNENTKPFFDSIGWSANDLSLFKQNYFMDQDTYSVEKLRRLTDYFPRFTLDKNSQGTFGMMFSNPFTGMELVFFFIALLFIPAESFGFILFYVGWIFLVLLFCRLYLWIPERIYIPCLFSLNNIAIFLSVSKFGSLVGNSSSPSRAFKWGAGFLTLFFIFSIFILHIDYAENRYWSYQELKLKAAMAEINPQDDQVFVVWGSSFPYIKIGAFDNDEFLQRFHVISVDWFQRTPTTSAMMDHFGLKNLFKDIVNNPKAFLICEPNQWNLYQVYMKEKFNVDVKLQFYFRSDQFAILSIHS